jgi:hypothetical protein
MNRSDPLNISEAKRLLSLNQKGVSKEEMIRLLKRSRPFLDKYFKEHKITYLYRPGKRFRDVEIQQILTLYDKGDTSISAISRRFGVCHETIKRIVEGHNVEKDAPEKVIKVKYIEEDGEKVCAGLSYSDYLRRAYGKDYKKYLSNSKNYAG